MGRKGIHITVVVCLLIKHKDKSFPNIKLLIKAPGTFDVKGKYPQTHERKKER